MLTYESLVQDPAQTCQQLEMFLPAPGAMDHTANLKVHSIDGPLDRPITDLNSKNIAALTADTIVAMNTLFTPHQETMAAWGYDLLTADEIT